MPIDTSSYYPEVPNPDGSYPEDSLNRHRNSLFGDFREPEPGKQPEETNEPDSKHSHVSEEEVKERGWEKCVSVFSHLISWALVPLMMPVYGIIFVFGLSVLDLVAPKLQVAFTFVVFGINFCIPMLMVLLLKFIGIVKDPSLNNRKERLIPYIITAFCLGCTSWYMASHGAPLWLDMFFAGGAVAALINLLVNFWWKISAHAAGIAGIVALLIRLEKDMAVEPQLFVWLLIVIGAAGLMGSARIWLGRHTAWQVLAGYAVGFCSVFFLMSI